ncbi:tRNA (adenosine(37)-N6)-threonylcarbamoyltransferase complex ATPase subunit type 1 TsaE [Patescibacteria group bacterium]|nr:tRNA (adenosine(37)-N6)-threonylcarbamoyltransferase complex ATPase subunit type 1 TsaE [Patescibacteria group bacterium]
MEVTTQNTKETNKLASKVAEKIKAGDVLALYGDLGSGKTTFVRFLVSALGFDARVQSPTFVIIRKYQGNNKVGLKGVNHLDLFRFQFKEELETLDLSGVLKEKDEISIIEWPELAEDYFDKDTIKLYFEDLGGDKRKITIENLEL